jgi:hypothetical protein
VVQTGPVQAGTQVAHWLVIRAAAWFGLLPISPRSDLCVSGTLWFVPSEIWEPRLDCLGRGRRELPSALARLTPTAA